MTNDFEVLNTSEIQNGNAYSLKREYKVNWIKTFAIEHSIEDAEQLAAIVRTRFKCCHSSSLEYARDALKRIKEMNL